MHRARVALAGLAAGVAMAAGLAVLPATAAPDSTGYGRGQEITARWWSVALSTGDLSFWEDSITGGNCRLVDLPSRPLVMVAGTLGGASDPRACSVPAGATLVLPVVNVFYANTEPAPVETIGLARRETRDFLAGATYAATVDGQAVEVRRIRSARFLLDGTALGIPELLPAVSDGYWLVVRLDPGVHTVTTTGSASGFDSATTYTFTVG